MRKINYFKRIIVSVDGDDEDLSAFIQSFGFAEEELSRVMDELNSFRAQSRNLVKTCFCLQ